jgi:hypothetical protein
MALAIAVFLLSEILTKRERHGKNSHDPNWLHDAHE